MRILEFEHKHFGVEDMKEILPAMGHELTVISTPLILERTSEEFDKLFDSLIIGNNDSHSSNSYCNTDKYCKYDAVFTFNYSVVVSNCCNRHNIPYIAWVYDSPLLTIYSYTITNPCNYIFLFDSEQYLQLKNGGINTVYYMPLAVNTARLDRMPMNTRVHQVFDSDVSFVGSMYNEKGNFYERLENISPYVKGYLDAVINAQQHIYGANFLEDVLSPDIIKAIQEITPYTPNKDGIETPSYVYANYFLARKVTQNERFEILKAVSDNFTTKLYTHNQTPELPDVINKINLNITLRSIKSGIPLRCMDIMGAGGFLLTNYQADFLEYFTPDKDFVYYESIDDLIRKCDYYIKHEDERKAIAQKGYNKVKEFPNYKVRINDIFKIAGLI